MSIEILRNKNLTTRFQILVEIADKGPNVQQRDIARKLDITPQAVSAYIAQLIKDGMIVSEGRSRYRMTNEAVDWIIKGLREISDYGTLVQKAITNISVCTAIAESDLTKRQKVGLKMKDGLLLATEDTDLGSTGIVVSDARKGEDVGVSDIEGIVKLKLGKVTILRIPGIQKGGSRTVDTEQLKSNISDAKPVGAIGIEAIVALRNLDIKPVYAYGATEAAIEAAKSGLFPVIVCVDDETPGLIARLEAQSIDYELRDMRREEAI
jgi:putative transcriptional regulator